MNSVLKQSPRLFGIVGGAALALLAGCAGGDVFQEKPPPGYVTDVAQRTAGVDWADAEAVVVTLSEFRFAPAQVVFRQGVPYRLSLRNTGQRSHTFVSEGFFKAIAAGRLVSSGTVTTQPYVVSIEVPTGAVKELYFVAVRKGTYDLQCTVFLHETFGMEGTITIR